MEDFWFVAFAMGLSQTTFFDGWDPNFDVIGELPYELATDILRLVDGRSLLAAALVCRKWRQLIRSDRVLRERVRSVFAAERMANLYWRTRTRRTAAAAAAATGATTRDTGSSEVSRSGGRRRNAISEEERRAFGIGERGKKRKFANEVSLRECAGGARPSKSKKAKKGGGDGGGGGGGCGESWTTKGAAVRLR